MTCRRKKQGRKHETDLWEDRDRWRCFLFWSSGLWHHVVWRGQWWYIPPNHWYPYTMPLNVSLLLWKPQILYGVIWSLDSPHKSADIEGRWWFCHHLDLCVPKIVVIAFNICLLQGIMLNYEEWFWLELVAEAYAMALKE
jgi:hypothetical protein